MHSPSKAIPSSINSWKNIAKTPGMPLPMPPNTILPYKVELNLIHNSPFAISRSFWQEIQLRVYSCNQNSALTILMMRINTMTNVLSWIITANKRNMAKEKHFGYVWR
jgi:hypothetical protein